MKDQTPKFKSNTWAIPLTLEERRAVATVLTYAVRLLSDPTKQESPVDQSVVNSTADASLRFAFQLDQNFPTHEAETWRHILHISKTLMDDESYFELRDLIRGYRDESTDPAPESTEICAAMIQVEDKIKAAYESNLLP